MKIKNVVTIGGGTGSFMLLTGLKKYPINIYAVVSMADDGGSTGILRDELGVLPPGDVRQCLVALSDSSETLRELMSYRFERGGLQGHSFGNIFLSALEKISGGFAKGVEEAAKILDVRGEVIPVSNDDMRLSVILNNGDILDGESQLDHNEKVRRIGVKNIKLKKQVRANQKALKRIKESDVIIIGPGDHFGSIMPNLLIKEIGQAIKNSRARVVYNCKLTNKKGQTENFDLDDYVNDVENHIGKGRVNYVTYNIAKPSKKLITKYKRREGENVLVGFSKNKQPKRNFKLIKADLLTKSVVKSAKEDANSEKRSFIRHDGKKLAKVLMGIIDK
jgi:uncharacterized cofD-like protein